MDDARLERLLRRSTDPPVTITHTSRAQAQRTYDCAVELVRAMPEPQGQCVTVEVHDEIAPRLGELVKRRCLDCRRPWHATRLALTRSDRCPYCGGPSS